MRLCSYLSENKLMYESQHVVLQLINQILDAFNSDNPTLSNL